MICTLVFMLMHSYAVLTAITVYLYVLYVYILYCCVHIVVSFLAIFKLVICIISVVYLQCYSVLGL